ncbi:hypothetical protein CCH79_00005178 [Gambusia affinis]|uniref:GRAM domain-containing protein n=1 Tax=Gambusia affinis TaxID=33528 RepID=A0A315VQB2_GAMAF|nr:hypothetical protein CCH79_00005178 [Gambusia affinis]
MDHQPLRANESALKVVDERSPLFTRRGIGKKCSRSQSLNLGTVKQQHGRQLNQSLRMGNRFVVLSYIKYNKTFHKLFQEIPAEERLTHTFTCSLQREVLYHGKLFVSENSVCFYSSVLLKETKVVIAISSVKEIKRHNPTLSVLSVLTSSGEKESSPSSSPYLSSAEFEHDAVSLRLRRLLGSKNPEANENDSQHPPILRLQASSFSSLEDSFESVVLSDSISLIDGGGKDADLNCSGKHLNIAAAHNNAFVSPPQLTAHASPQREAVLQMKMTELGLGFGGSLRKMLLLLLLSGYIGLRITALEEQLSSLGALTDLSPLYAEQQLLESAFIKASSSKGLNFSPASD